ncbi:MAG: ABC transporter permease [Coriobacteriales bacterium]|nr:ABC transporter permease [Coriobacteriales bacterium]
MFWRMVAGTLFRQSRKMLLIALTIALGASLATAMLNVMLGVGEKVNRELKTFGANITIVPRDASLIQDLYEVEGDEALPVSYLQESELGSIKTIFWAHNIVDFAPYFTTTVQVDGQNDSSISLTGTWFSQHLSLPTGEEVDTGMRNLRSWWEVTGAWADDAQDGSAMLGAVVAERWGLAVGDTFTVSGTEGRSRELTVVGIFSAGSDEDERIFVPLATAQDLADKTGLVSSIEVSALTTPDNELAQRAAQNIKALSQQEYETWYCTAYVSAICYQLDEVITDGAARPVRQVAQSEGAILEKTQLLMLLITILSLVGAALGISNLVTASVMERGREIGLLKAIGAYDGAVLRLVLAEILIACVLGGIVGYFAGLGFAQIIAQTVFSSDIEINSLVPPIVAVLVVLVTLAGSVPSIRLLLSLHPAEVLHGR